MEEKQKLIIACIIALVISFGAYALAWKNHTIREDKNQTYKNLLNNMNESIRSTRLGKDPSNSLTNVQNNYASLTEGENFLDTPDLQILDNQIKNSFNPLIGKKENARTGEILNLRNKISRITAELNVDLPFAYKYSSLIILLISVPLAFVSTFFCRSLINWDKLKEAKQDLEKWRTKIRGAQRKRGKKKRKKELEKEKVEDSERKTWGISIKQATFYFGPFFLFLALLTLLYGDWIVAWLPFNWFNSGILQSIGVSFNYYGWFFLTYFGSAQIWRVFLIPRTESMETSGSREE